MKCYCFPIFQRSFGFTSLPFFQTDCKGKGLYISNQIFFCFSFKKRRVNWYENQLVCEELRPVFLRRIAKVRHSNFLPNFYSLFLNFFLLFFFQTSSENYPLSIGVAKLRHQYLPANFISNHFGYSCRSFFISFHRAVPFFKRVAKIRPFYFLPNIFC